MVKLAGIFSRFQPIKAVVIGDFMLDTYTTGKVERISPEAPVSVLKVEKEESRPGGAGNVVLNLISLGAKVMAIGRIGSDYEGKKLLKILKESGASIEGLLTEENYKTPVKNRLIADSQQILRVDTETVTPLPQEYEIKLYEILPALLEGAQVVAISDYSKGFLTDTLIARMIEESTKRSIPVIVDPKDPNFSKYQGASVIKPNLSEAYAAAKLSRKESLQTVADTILRELDFETLLITRSSDGMSSFDKLGRRNDFPVRSREVKDVTGAGDTVLAMISTAIANGLDIEQAAQLANVAAGIAIERLGCARVTLSDLARRLLEYDSDNKIFDESHLYALKQVLIGKCFSVLGIDSKQGITTAIFRTIRSLSMRKMHELVVYVRDSNPDVEFVNLLSSLNEVNFIILQRENLENLCEEIHPKEVFVMQKDRVIELDHAKALLCTIKECV